MSRIEKRIKELKSRRKREGWKEGKKVAVSFRVDPFTLFCLDEVVKEVGGTRTSAGIELITEGVLDCLAALGRDFDSLFSDYMQKDGGGLFFDGVKLDPEEVKEVLANGGEKYGFPVGQMTEEQIEQAEAEEQEKAEKEKEAK